MAEKQQSKELRGWLYIAAAIGALALLGGIAEIGD